MCVSALMIPWARPERGGCVGCGMEMEREVGWMDGENGLLLLVFVSPCFLMFRHVAVSLTYTLTHASSLLPSDPCRGHQPVRVHAHLHQL